MLPRSYHERPGRHSDCSLLLTPFSETIEHEREYRANRMNLLDLRKTAILDLLIPWGLVMGEDGFHGVTAEGEDSVWDEEQMRKIPT